MAHRSNTLLAVKLIVRLSILPLSILVLAVTVFSQQFSSNDRAGAQEMLRLISADIRKHYYDPQFRGVDWDGKVLQAKQRIDSAPSLNVAMASIAQALDTLNDSHTFFLPPPRRVRLDYEWAYQMIGDKCYFVGVRPKSDAEAKGVKPGDELLAINGVVPSRDNLEKLTYVFQMLRPLPQVTLDLRDPAGHQRQIQVNAKTIVQPHKDDWKAGGGDLWRWKMNMEEWQRQIRGRYAEIGDVLVLKFPAFFFSEADADGIISKASQHRAFIVDLRSNEGGSEATLQYLLGGMFEQEVKIANRVGREVKESVVAKPRRKNFSGKLVVLVDSRSYSAAELFARVIQLEKRGLVLGDRSAGSVMEARDYTDHIGIDTLIYFGASITHADLIMPDGKSLERAGVVPDEIVLPTAEDIAAGRDPVLARAAEVAGAKLSAQTAGRLFPYVWPSW
jgi:C-terminal processing protease CtpA/Prc